MRRSPFREPPERTRAFTEALVKAVVPLGHSTLTKTDQETGTVIRFSDIPRIRVRGARFRATTRLFTIRVYLAKAIALCRGGSASGSQ